jgi:O-acetylhomoserine (thiol)-lyase
MKNETIAVHSGYESEPTTKAVAVPIYQTVSHEFDSADHAAALFELDTEGWRYARIANPTCAVLERRLAVLEGGLEAVVTSSGQAATFIAVTAIAEVGTNIVSVPQLYGTTHALFAHTLPKHSGVTVKFADSDDPAIIAKLIDVNTRAVFCESVGNPAGNICDLAALAVVAHQGGVPLVVDNTVATPILLKPIEHGADIVIHSLTKFLGGHGTTLGGVVIDSGKFPWRDHLAAFSMLSMPEPTLHNLVFTERFGDAAYAARVRRVIQRITGAVLSPLSAFLLLQGVETVALRVERHVTNARAVAEFLRRHPQVAWVNYAGFDDNPYFPLAMKYLKGQVPSLLTFGVEGGYEAGKRFYDALRLIKRLVNIGDAKSLACHPASSTHKQMDAHAQAQAGVTPDMIRLSIGIEHIDDIIADLDQALCVARQWAGQRLTSSSPSNTEKHIEMDFNDISKPA